MRIVSTGRFVALLVLVTIALLIMAVVQAHSGPAGLSTPATDGSSHFFWGDAR